jgi:hypothetical protein
LNKKTTYHALFFINIVLFVCTFFNAQAQYKNDNSFKMVASMSGLGLAYEYNPVSIVYVQGSFTSAYTLSRFGLQSKLALLKRGDYKIKAGVEGAYFLGDTLRVGSVRIGYPRPFEFMPLFAFESKIVGIEIPLIIARDFSSVFPMVALTLNISKDEKVKISEAEQNDRRYRQMARKKRKEERKKKREGN